jgi:hypothetical protein
MVIPSNISLKNSSGNLWEFFRISFYFLKDFVRKKLPIITKSLLCDKIKAMLLNFYVKFFNQNSLIPIQKKNFNGFLIFYNVTRGRLKETVTVDNREKCRFFCHSTNQFKQNPIAIKTRARLSISTQVDQYSILIMIATSDTSFNKPPKFHKLIDKNSVMISIESVWDYQKLMTIVKRPKTMGKSSLTLRLISI